MSRTSSDDENTSVERFSSDDDSSASSYAGFRNLLNLNNILDSSSSSIEMANISSSEDSFSAWAWANRSNASSFSEQEEDLHDVVERESVESVSRMISDKVDLNDCGMKGYPPLHPAVKSKNVDIVKLLIEAGANVNATNVITKESPLHLAVKVVSYDVVKMLLDAGAEVNAKDQEEFTPLHLAAKLSLKIFTLLVSAGANINAKSLSRMTPLHYAASAGKINILKMLLDSGADVNAKNSERHTPLHQAAYGMNGVSIFKHLFDAGANANVKDMDKNTPLKLLVYQMNYSKSDRKCGMAEKSLRLIIEYTDVNIASRKYGNIISSLMKSSMKSFHKVIIEHLAKLNLLGLPIDSELLDAISSSRELNEYLKKCLDELKEAKSTKLNKCWVTFFNLLVDDERKLVRYAGNKDVTTEIKNTNVEEKFPIFGTAIQINMAKGVMGRKLFDGAANALSQSVPIFSPTHLVVRDVLDTVNEEDWKSLCEKKRRRK